MDLEALDKYISNSPQHQWTKESHDANHLIWYWWAKISLEKNNIEAINIFMYLYQKIPPDLDIYQGNTTCTLFAQLWKAKKTWQQAFQDSYKKRQANLEKQTQKHKDMNNNDKVAKEVKLIKHRKSRN